MEHWEELKPGGYRMAWDDALFRPGTDSFVLSSFPSVKPGLRVCDLGSGTGVLGLLLLQRQGRMSVTGLEIQREAAALAERCAAENGLGERLKTLCLDLRYAAHHLPGGMYDLAVCNPPYYAAGSGKESGDDARRTSRSEVSCTLEDVAVTARYLLRQGGRLCLVHRPERLTDLLVVLRQHSLEPKRARFVCARPGAAPSLVLLEGRKGGGPGLAVEPELALQTADGSPTAEYNAIYFREEASS